MGVTVTKEFMSNNNGTYDPATGLGAVLLETGQVGMVMEIDDKTGSAHIRFGNHQLEQIVKKSNFMKLHWSGLPPEFPSASPSENDEGGKRRSEDDQPQISNTTNSPAESLSSGSDHGSPRARSGVMAGEGVPAEQANLAQSVVAQRSMLAESLSEYEKSASMKKNCEHKKSSLTENSGR
eukprot:gene23474-13267_t